MPFGDTPKIQTNTITILYSKRFNDTFNKREMQLAELILLAFLYLVIRLSKVDFCHVFPSETKKPPAIRGGFLLISERS